MQFDLFLKEPSKFLDDNKAICFVGDHYPLLFLAKFFSDKNISTMTTDTVDSKEIISTLSQSFLGSTNTYFFGELKNDKKKNEAIFNNLDVHKVIFFLKKDSKFIPKNVHLVELCDVDRKLFEKLAVLLGKANVLKKRPLIDLIFKRTTILSLDNTARLYDYLEVVGINSHKEFDKYLTLLLDPEKSFFTLSNYFFSRNRQSFFKLWSELSGDYPPVFWISFWSEQVWRAHHVCKYLEKKDMLNAKRMSSRLPFSFIRSYWKNYTTRELILEHNFLYQSDCKVKSGSTFHLLELFYSKHFSKQF